MAQDPIWGNLFRKKEGWVSVASELCALNPLFDRFTPSVIDWIVGNASLRHFKSGESIFRMGDEGAGALLLLSGQVSIQTGGKELASVEQGDLFGEVALLPDQYRTADAIATQDCEILFFLRSEISEWKENHPKQAYRLMENLAKMLSKRLLEKNKIQSAACNKDNQHL
ncbi:MAG: cyclic nucleotide-binding domain-containing protein [Zetaproteobacteria bacterium CG_4_9_14_3_um_filter_49_83]|nr:MAG: hypothetical protein AUJ56_12480 [Zetaproteobacteria bacterium CG1_02_49_23]PIQ34576.1 MAG: cyclic nucleotide-binding protein [Zetaproteobacteria bacterium CG17_big_fil_post_rev_8_21_14_2_50_50_13]PIV31565.1 MAG: cyclic nucleotide-binding domain-containing protein [Zetaproteobacteria bacterium CG02_land_8_20_14_3_00_50_9]PIY54839.1 MAG: cyclic nucleotide-binding domain-containing protein [Zetaproteobacteria bacterium CG_4_10_14_0_8_um_filter_49_80]PJA35794.1 MAG: cyclic nucleotide-bindi